MVYQLLLLLQLVLDITDLAFVLMTQTGSGGGWGHGPSKLPHSL